MSSTTTTITDYSQVEFVPVHQMKLERPSIIVAGQVAGPGDEVVQFAPFKFHIDEETSHDEREKFRDVLLAMEGVMAAAGQDKRPHLMLIEYNPDVINSMAFVNAAKQHGLHGELIGF